MKATAVFLALCAAHLAMCAPIAEFYPAHAVDTSGRDPKDPVTPTAWLPIGRGDKQHPVGDEHSPRSQPRLSPIGLLPSLSKHRTPKKDRQESPEMRALRLYYPGHHEDDDILELLDVDVVGPHQPGLPCHGGHRSHERNDMLIVYLAGAFMLVVVGIEAFGTILRRERAIKLEETSQPPPASISIRADAGDELGMMDEKRGV
ncbi:uncharacterized protein C8A04DRAFT_26465 [Dichotomopilus funicola]|uniref:Uncharacterized protein n=1 Tax=Dichotomopilus funicola TaxID=1934379 RepID=A0AAN6V6M2_9PEZI|nr:hypothetical protein C8A04DRAFT_26465 [Dichotomopilus funicola]